MRLVEAVIFDFGHVIGTFDKRIACAVLAHHSRYSVHEIHDLLVGGDLEKQVESGQMSDTAFARELLHRIDCSLTVPDVFRIWGNIFRPNPDIEPFIEHLIERKVKIGVLSNTSGVHWPFVGDLSIMAKLAKYGAPLTLSHEVRVMKPDPRIYELALASLSVKAPVALYIDDIEENVIGARKVGMYAEQYDCTKRKYSQLRLRAIFESYKLL